MLPTVEARKKSGVISLKEEAHASHCNQSFDQMLAKNDKKVAAENLAKQTRMKKVSNSLNFLTRWDLVLARIDIVLKSTPPKHVNSLNVCTCILFTESNSKNGQRNYLGLWTQILFSGKSALKMH